MSDLLDAVAARFGLGAPVSAVDVEGGFSNRLVRLDTDRGRYAVKVLDRSLAANHDAALERAVDVELRVAAAGVRVPAPVRDGDGRVLVELDDDLVRVHEWVVGWSPDSGPAGTELAREVGAWLAAVHRLALPSDDGLADLDDVSGTERWRELVAAAGDEPFEPALRDALGSIERAVDLVRAAERRHPVIGTHRDLFPRNALVTAEGLSVCDWDVAGGWTAAEEIAAAAVDWSGGILGPVDAQSFTALLDGYRDAGGEPPPVDEGAWSGYLVKQLGWLEAHVARALDPPTPDAGRVAAHRLPFLVPRLVRQVAEVPRWVELVGTHDRIARSGPVP